MVKAILWCVVCSTAVLAATPRAQSFNRPVLFEPNQGQAPAGVRWIARGPGYQLLLTSDGVSIVLPDRAPETQKPESAVGRPSTSSLGKLGMHLAGNPAWNSISGLEATGGVSNYLLGGDPSKWHTHVPHFSRLRVAGVYKGIDLVFYGSGSNLEYDFVVAPGADPRQIELTFDGAKNIAVEDKTGDLLLTISGGLQLRHIRPRIYQQIRGRKVEVDGGYKMLDDQHIAFTLGAYNRRNSLVIDPTVTFTTFIQGNAEDLAMGIAADNAGNSYITGTTQSTDFPIVGGIPPAPNKQCTCFAYVTKLSPSGAILFSTFIGGSSVDTPQAIAVDSSGIYVAGDTLSHDFATNSQFASSAANADNVFVAKLSLAGDALNYCTTFGGDPVGGDNVNQPHAIALDSSHAAYIAGHTVSPSFPTSLTIGSTVPPMQGTFAGGFIDGFVSKLDSNGKLTYSTFLGGNEVDSANGIAVDGAGNAYVTGTTHSPNFPVFGATSYGSPATGDFTGSTAFVTKIFPDGSGAAYSIFLGGTHTADSSAPGDSGNSITTDQQRNTYITGEACSVDFPTTPNAFQSTAPGSCSAFATKLDNSGRLLFSTYLGGTNGFSVGNSISVNGLQQVYVAGFSSSTTFPGAPFTPNPYIGFVSKLSPTLGSLNFTTLLGDMVNGMVVRQTSRFPIIDLFLPTTIYTTGVRYRPGSDVNNNSNLDVFVVKLNDPPLITLLL